MFVVLPKHLLATRQGHRVVVAHPVLYYVPPIIISPEQPNESEALTSDLPCVIGPRFTLQHKAGVCTIYESHNTQKLNILEEGPNKIHRAPTYYLLHTLCPCHTESALAVPYSKTILPEIQVIELVCPRQVSRRWFQVPAL